MTQSQAAATAAIPELENDDDQQIPPPPPEFVVAIINQLWKEHYREWKKGWRPDTSPAHASTANPSSNRPSDKNSGRLAAVPAATRPEGTEDYYQVDDPSSIANAQYQQGRLVGMSQPTAVKPGNKQAEQKEPAPATRPRRLQMIESRNPKEHDKKFTDPASPYYPFWLEAQRLISENGKIETGMRNVCELTFALILALHYFPLFRGRGFVTLGLDKFRDELGMQAWKLRQSDYKDADGKVHKSALSALVEAGLVIICKAEPGSGLLAPEKPDAVKWTEYEQLQYDLVQLRRQAGGKLADYWTKNTVQKGSLFYRLGAGVTLSDTLPEFNPFESGYGIPPEAGQESPTFEENTPKTPVSRAGVGQPVSDSSLRTINSSSSSSSRKGLHAHDADAGKDKNPAIKATGSNSKEPTKREWLSHLKRNPSQWEIYKLLRTAHRDLADLKYPGIGWEKARDLALVVEAATAKEEVARWKADWEAGDLKDNAPAVLIWRLEHPGRERGPGLEARMQQEQARIARRIASRGQRGERQPGGNGSGQSYRREREYAPRSERYGGNGSSKAGSSSNGNGSSSKSFAERFPGAMKFMSKQQSGQSEEEEV